MPIFGPVHEATGEGFLCNSPASRSTYRVEASSSNFPKYTRNPNTGEGTEIATEFKKVKQTIHHSPEFPSHDVLPVMK